MGGVVEHGRIEDLVDGRGCTGNQTSTCIHERLQSRTLLPRVRAKKLPFFLYEAGSTLVTSHGCIHPRLLLLISFLFGIKNVNMLHDPTFCLNFFLHTVRTCINVQMST